MPATWSFKGQEQNPVIAGMTHVDSLRNGKWIRCFRTAGGTIFFHGSLMSTDNGKTVVSQTIINLEDITAAPERAVLSTKNLFYALNGTTQFIAPGVYNAKAWRSVDGLKTLQTEKVTIYVPDGAQKKGESMDWFGLFVYRTILEMPDGRWLMTMYGNFVTDTIIPTDNDAQKEIRYMTRTFLVTSSDKGLTWHYLSSIAVPHAGDPVGEGFGEPAITLLKDGRLLCVMRTGHHFPLYASWSSDGGHTWTAPLYTGLDRGCDPCLITLRDGRVALSWGKRYAEGWSRITAEGDQVLFKYPGEGYTNLAVSNDAGLTWTNHPLLKKSGSCYSTIFELEPNLIFFQVDQWYSRIKLKPDKAAIQ